MSTEIKAIQTHYDGRYFRSRCEARWAVFFKTLGLAYDYEFEGYQLPSGWYLPDFYIPSLDCFIEIKGREPTEKENTLLYELENMTCKRCFFCVGNPGWPDNNFDDYDIFSVSDGGDRSVPYFFCECEDCGKIGIEYMGRATRICKHHKYDYIIPISKVLDSNEWFRKGLHLNTNKHYHVKGECWDDEKGYNFQTIKLKTAFESALSERFES